MNIFVDVGAWKGDSIKEFRNWSKLLEVGDDWCVIAWEPNTKLHSALNKNLKKGDILIDKAAWIFDGRVMFSRNDKWDMGSTVMPEKINYKDGELISVECLDFSKWLGSYKGHEGYMIVKMDIEGAELPIISQLIHDGHDTIADKMMVEWHDGKMPQYESNKDWIWASYKGRLELWR